MPQNHPEPGEVYRHFKHRDYQILHIGVDADSMERVVIYQAMYGDNIIYVRRESEFISSVDYDKYPEATERFRFTLIEKKQPVQEELQSQEIGAIAVMMQYFDTDDYDEKYKLLKVLETESDLNNQIIDNIAAASDLVIDDGDLMNRFDELKRCIRTRARFETKRLR